MKTTKLKIYKKHKHMAANQYATNKQWITQEINEEIKNTQRQTKMKA